MYKGGIGTSGGLAVTGAALSWWIALAVALVGLAVVLGSLAVRKRRLERDDKEL